MSVTTDKRTPTEDRFETGEAFRNMAAYVVRIAKNEKNFPKRDRWIITYEFAKAAVKAYGHVVAANETEVNELDDYQYRRGQQVKAKAALKKTLSYAEIAYTELGLGADKLETLTGLVMKCRSLLSAWRESDRKRYKAAMEAKERDKKGGTA